MMYGFSAEHTVTVLVVVTLQIGEKEHRWILKPELVLRLASMQLHVVRPRLSSPEITH